MEKDRQCKDCKWYMEVNFGSLVGSACIRRELGRWWPDNEAIKCWAYKRKFWKIWRPK